jgi:hypothetical protein
MKVMMVMMAMMAKGCWMSLLSCSTLLLKHRKHTQYQSKDNGGWVEVGKMTKG